MKEKKNYPNEADAIQNGLTKKKTNEKEIYRISQAMGMTKNDIKSTLKKNRYTIAVAVVFVIAGLVSGNFYFIGNHYGTGSIADFQMLKWFL